MTQILPPGLRGYVVGEQQGMERDRTNLQQGMGVLQMLQAQRQMQFEDQLKPLQVQQLQAALRDAEQSRAIRQGVLSQITGGASGGSVSPQGALSLGAAQGDVGPTETNAGRIGAPSGGVLSGGIPGVNPMAALMMLSGDAGLGKVGTAIQEANKPLVGRENAPILERGPDGQWKVAFAPAPKLDQGQRFDYGTGQVSTVPGYTQSAAEIEAARTGAREGAGAPFRFREVPLSTGGSQLMRESEIPGAPQVSASLSTIPYVPPEQQRQTAANMDAGLTPSGSGPAIPSASVLGRTQPPGQRAAAETSGREEAQLVSGYRQKIPALNTTLRRLDMLERLNTDDTTFAAAGAEFKTMLGSIAQSVGVDIGNVKTANSELYLAQIGELMKDRLASKDYGSGSGVSNLDLLAARQPLPELAKTQQGRSAIIQAIRADTSVSISDLQAATQHFDRNLSLSGFQYPSSAARANQGPNVDATIRTERPRAPAARPAGRVVKWNEL